MSTTQIIAIAVVACVAVGGVGIAYMFMDNNDDAESPYRSADTSGRLMVMGNANNDDYLDEQDIDTLREIIDSGVWDKNKHPYADANNDGVVDEQDIAWVRDMIDGKKTMIYLMTVENHFLTMFFEF